MSDLAIRNQSDVGRFQSGLNEISTNLTTMLPSHISVETFKRVALIAVQRNPDLLRADRKKLFLALQRAAGDGLLPDGREGAIVMYGPDPTWMPMIAGLRKLLRNSGEILSITSQVVYEGETFRVVLGDDERIEHERRIDLASTAKPIAVYAIAKLKSGEIVREVMNEAELQKIKALSRGKVWDQHPGEMRRKTVERRISKRLPMSIDREGDRRLLSALEDEATTLHFTPDAPTERPRLASKLDALEATYSEEPDDDGVYTVVEALPEVEADPVYDDPDEASYMIEQVQQMPEAGALDAMLRSKTWIAALKKLTDEERARVSTAVQDQHRSYVGSLPV